MLPIGIGLLIFGMQLNNLTSELEQDIGFCLMTQYLDERFTKAMQWLFEAEGVYSNDPVDRGGETKYGISKRSYPDLDIKNLTKEQAIAIYYKDFWLPLNPDKYDESTLIVLFDTAVNHGLGRAKSWIKTVDGNWNQFLQKRMAFYKQIVERDPPQKRFLHGWQNRLARLKRFVLCCEAEKKNV
jgi:Glycosyl hydrolase 108